MATTIKQSGAQSATWFSSAGFSALLDATKWAELPEGKLKDFVTTPFTSRAEALEAWALAGGSVSVSGSSTENVFTTFSLSGGTTGTPVISATGLDVEAPGYAVRVSVSYSASE